MISLVDIFVVAIVSQLILATSRRVSFLLLLEHVLLHLELFLVIFIFFTTGVKRMVERDNPDYASYFLPASRGIDDQLSIPELGGQMYIGLKQRKETNIPGSFTDTIIPFDERYINGKIDYFDNSILQGRENMTACEDRQDFKKKVNYTSDLSEEDFPNMLCIPADKFKLYNEPSENLANSIGLLFEQCGGKNSRELEYTESTDLASSLASISSIT